MSYRVIDRMGGERVAMGTRVAISTKVAMGTRVAIRTRTSIGWSIAIGLSLLLLCLADAPARAEPAAVGPAIGSAPARAEPAADGPAIGDVEADGTAGAEAAIGAEPGAGSWTGGAVTAVAVDGNVAWTVIGTRLVAWDLDASPPRELGRSAPLPEVAEDVAVGDSMAIVATRGVGTSPAAVHVFDVADPRSPARLGSTELARSRAREVGGVARSVDGSLVLLVTEKGLSIVDISDPAAGVEVAWVLTGNRVKDAAFEAHDWEGDVVAAPDGRHALVARPWGLYSVFIGDGRAPYVVLDPAQRADPVGGWRSVGIAIDGSVAWLIDAEAEALVALDVSDAAWPIELGRTPVDAAPRAVAASGGRVVVLAQDGARMIAFDGRTPSAPKRGASAALDAVPSVHARIALAGADGSALAAMGGLGLHVVDGLAGDVVGDSTEDPDDRPGTHAEDWVDESDGMVRAADEPIDSPAAGRGPAAGAELRASRVESIVPPLSQLEIVDRRIALAAAGPSGIVALDVADPVRPALIGRLDVRTRDGETAAVHSLRRVESTLFALTDVTGLVALDLTGTPYDSSDRFDATFYTDVSGVPARRDGPAYDDLAALPGRKIATTLDVAGHEIAFADGRGDIRIVDVRDPDRPRLVSHVPGDFRDVVFAGRFLYALDIGMGFGRLSVIARPAFAPEGRAYVVSELALPRPFGRLFSDGERLFLSGEPSTAALGVVSLVDPTAPRLVGFVDGLAAGRPLTDGSGALTADRERISWIDFEGGGVPAAGDDMRRLAWGRARSDDAPSDIHRVGDTILVLRGRAGLFGLERPGSEATVVGAETERSFIACAPPQHVALVIDKATPAELRLAMVEAAQAAQDASRTTASERAELGLGIAGFGAQAERYVDVATALAALSRPAAPTRPAAANADLRSDPIVDIERIAVRPRDAAARLDLALAASAHELRAALGAPGPGGVVLLVVASPVFDARAFEGARARSRALIEAGAIVHVVDTGMSLGPDGSTELVAELVAELAVVPGRAHVARNVSAARALVQEIVTGACESG